jgi:hypothetical protein
MNKSSVKGAFMGMIYSKIAIIAEKANEEYIVYPPKSFPMATNATINNMTFRAANIIPIGMDGIK